ncbi:hypothetical protein H5410_008081 [Solanum commersonii]|uniref:Uncharacterized protein n=1 Tax=Solanum commersonii TaxID=4109 RepID=A0A9J6AFU2_SOLCO|nr:hypothetical protein H5410_008081 [Solanum commersonii]
METEGNVNAASTSNVRSDGGRKNRKGKKHQKSNEEMLQDPTPSEALTSHLPSTTEEVTMNLVRRPLTSPLEKNESQELKWQGRPWRY